MSVIRTTKKVDNATTQSNYIDCALMDALNIKNVNPNEPVKTLSDKIKLAIGAGGTVTPTQVKDTISSVGDVVADFDGDGKVKLDYASDAKPMVYKGDLSTAILPSNPEKCEFWVWKNTNDADITISEGDVTLNAFTINNNCSKIHFDTSMEDSDVNSIIRGLDYTVPYAEEGQLPIIYTNNSTAVFIVYVEDIRELLPESEYTGELCMIFAALEGVVFYCNQPLAEMGVQHTGWQTEILDENGNFDLTGTSIEGTITDVKQGTTWNNILISNVETTESQTIHLTYNDWLWYTGITWDKVDAKGRDDAVNYQYRFSTITEFNNFKDKGKKGDYYVYAGSSSLVVDGGNRAPLTINVGTNFDLTTVDPSLQEGSNIASYINSIDLGETTGKLLFTAGDGVNTSVYCSVVEDNGDRYLQFTFDSDSSHNIYFNASSNSIVIGGNTIAPESWSIDTLTTNIVGSVQVMDVDSDFNFFKGSIFKVYNATYTLNNGDWLVYNGNFWDLVIGSNVNKVIGDINTILDSINGEVI